MTEGTPTHVEELLSRFGPKLKAARAAKDLTIQEISSRTRINKIFLQQIEAGRTETLPGLTFVRGFIRNYMQVLDLRDEEIEDDLRKFSGLEQYIAETTLGPKINEMHGDDEAPAVPARKKIVLALVFVIVVALGYLGARILSSPAEPPDRPAVAEQQALEQPSEDAPPAAAEPPADSPRPPAAEALKRVDKGAPVPSGQNLRLTMRGLEPTWIRLSIDRAPPMELRLEPAETMNWEANEEFRLVIGKSHGVAVYLNGEDILLPEERDRLIPDIVLNRLTLLRLEN